jgi:drug/metabolite transporter (DMT)-like permease
MIYLWLVSLIWAFSFGLIKNRLVGLDASFIAAARLWIAFAVLLPFLRLGGVKRSTGLRLTLAGICQFGLMYLAYNYSFHYLQAYEVALFTIFTPIYVTLIDDAIQRHLNKLHLGVAALAVVGTAIVEQGNWGHGDVLAGFLLVQVSNLCFAFGQVYYVHVMKSAPGVSNRQVFGLLYLGGAMVTSAVVVIFTPWQQINLTSTQAWTLVYLGAVASGLGFFLWNKGARLVDIGTLAIFNDLKIPLAVVVSLVFFGELVSLPHLLVGGAIIFGALVLNEREMRRSSPRAVMGVKELP